MPVTVKAASSVSSVINSADTLSSSSSSEFPHHYKILYHQLAPRYDEISISGHTSAFGEWDGEIVTMNPATGQTGAVLVPSIKKAIPSLQEPWNMSLVLYAEPDVGDPVFKQVRMESDSYERDLYAYDKQDASLHHLQMSSAMCQFPLFNFLSPDQKYVACVIENSLTMIDLVHDRILFTKKAPEGKVFNRSSHEEMDWVSDAQWIDSTHIRTALYDSTGPYVSRMKPVDTIIIGVGE
jgi:hypothetical protein